MTTVTGLKGELGSGLSETSTTSSACTGDSSELLLCEQLPVLGAADYSPLAGAGVPASVVASVLPASQTRIQVASASGTSTSGSGNNSEAGSEVAGPAGESFAVANPLRAGGPLAVTRTRNERAHRVGLAKQPSAFKLHSRSDSELGPTFVTGTAAVP